MTRNDFIDLDKYILEQMGVKEFNLFPEEEDHEYKNIYHMHHLVHAILVANDYDPERIHVRMKSAGKRMAEQKNAIEKAYKELHEALFCPLDDIPLYVNTFFNMVVQWRLKRAI
jgi:hypothetical protein